jgi:hypothetical protein
VSAAHHAGQDAYLPDLRTEVAGRYYRLGVLLAAVCIPTAFWLLALHLAGYAAGINISTTALTGFSLALGASCFAALAMAAGDRR